MFLLLALNDLTPGPLSYYSQPWAVLTKLSQVTRNRCFRLTDPGTVLILGAPPAMMPRYLCVLVTAVPRLQLHDKAGSDRSQIPVLSAFLLLRMTPFSPKSIRIIGDSSDSLGEFRVSGCPRFQATWQGEPPDPLCMCLYQYKSCQVLRSRMNNSIMIRPQVCSSPQQSVVSYTTTMQWQPLRGAYQQGLVDIEHSSETADNYGHLRSARRVPMTKYLRALLSAREHTENMALEFSIVINTPFR
ncbi:hypothetical protein HD554DRAFT_676957 [Boletus coccyginus]|nr:hypothetical protein HD554DRAFT_676957 [Boletus coccyginus]